MNSIYVVTTTNETARGFEDAEFAVYGYADRVMVWAVVEKGFRTVYFDTPAAARLYVDGVDGLREVSRDENDSWGIAHEVGTPKGEDFAIPVHIVNVNAEYGSEEE